MTRIIAGSAGGRRVRTPAGDGTRPTTDRVREALFSALESEFGSLVGIRVLDLYAGSGALGLEAASRGADPVWAVESDRRTAALLRDNARTLGVDRQVVVRAELVARVLERAPDVAFDVVVCDPPYPATEEEVGEVLHRLSNGGWLAPGAVVVVERSRRSPAPSWPANLVPWRHRRYGEAVLWYVRAGSSAESGDLDE